MEYRKLDRVNATQIKSFFQKFNVEQAIQIELCSPYVEAGIQFNKLHANMRHSTQDNVIRRAL